MEGKSLVLDKPPQPLPGSDGKARILETYHVHHESVPRWEGALLASSAVLLFVFGKNELQAPFVVA